MAAPYAPIIKGQDYVRYITLQDFANPGSFKANPTLAAGDVTISKDGGAFANLNTLPTVTPASGVGVKVLLSATEMDADNILVVFSDQTSPKEWADFAFSIETEGAIEGSYTAEDLLRLIAAASAGKVSGAGTTTVTIRDVADARDAIVATVDTDGNRSAVTLDPS